MTKNKTQQKQLTSISITKETKNALDKKMSHFNEIRKSKLKLYPDDLLTFLIQNIDNEQAKKFVNSKMTWEDEEPLLMKRYQKESGKEVSKFEWEQLKIKGQLLKFLNKNSIVLQQITH